MNKPFSLTSMALPLLMFFFSCVDTPVPNDEAIMEPQSGTITGKLFTPSKHPAVHAAVKIYPVDFVPWLSAGAALSKKNDVLDASFTFYTDSEGVYTIPLPDSGIYNIVAISDEMTILIPGIAVSGKESKEVPADTVRAAGGIDGTTNLRDENDTDQVRVTLYIPGTKWITKPRIGGSFTLSALPQGNYQLVVVPDLDNYNVRVVDVVVASGEQKHLDTIRLDKKVDDGLVYLDTSHTFSVAPDVKWHSTGKNIAMGNSMVIKASGSVTSGELGTFGPDGGTALGGLSFLLVNQPVFALFAKIGQGTPFKIGSSYMGIAQQSGELQFAVNSQKYIVKVVPAAPDTSKNKVEPVIDTSTAAVTTGSFLLDSLVVRKK